MKRSIVHTLFVCIMISACSSPTQTQKESPKDDMTSKNDDFPWDERTSFVLYAGQSEDDNPDESFPSLIIHEYDAEKNFMMSDGAPYLTVLSKEDMLIEVLSFKRAATDSSENVIASRVEEWVVQKVSEGYNAFLYELEPPSMAGKAYPIASKAEAAE